MRARRHLGLEVNPLGCRAVLWPLCRHLAQTPAGPRSGDAAEAEATQPLSSSRSLEKTTWLTLHPVIKWTLLVDVARRAPYLLEKPVTTDTDTSAKTESPAVARGTTLAQKDSQVHFSDEATQQHARLCAALPYPSRLILSLSLLMWLRSLRDVQDTLARVRLPYAPTQRFRHILVAHVFPTRLQEYWCDHCTTVAVRMDPLLNSTAEQVPAPHAWDPATSETMEDSVSESTVVLQGHSGKGLLGGASRADVVRQIQGTTARPSDDDALAARVTGSRTLAGHTRRRLAAAKARDRALLGGVNAVSHLDPSEANTEKQATPPRAPTRAREQWSRPDSQRTIAPVAMDREHREDAEYHNNMGRGEGCPLSDSGALHPTPIHITMPSASAALMCEANTRACVMAHAAILSALFVEGRVVAFTTDLPLVKDYVECLFEAWIRARYMTVALITERTSCPVTAPSTLRAYYPDWCFKAVLVVLPPRRQRRLFSSTELQNLARTIVKAAPCAVMVDGALASSEDCSTNNGPVRALEPTHVAQLKAAVAALQVELSALASPASPGDAMGGSADDWLRVEWVPVRLGVAAHPGGGGDGATTSTTTHDGSVVPAFVPKHTLREASSATSDTPASPMKRQRLLSWVTSMALSCCVSSSSSSSSPSPPPSKRTGAASDGYLAAVAAALEGGEFYGAQILHVPGNCLYTSREIRQWLLERLPSNVRLVGVNTSPLDVLFFYPQAPFLTSKVGNCFRYRGVDRVLVEKFGAGWAADPLRACVGRYRLARRGRTWDRVGLHGTLALRDRVVCAARERTAHAGTTDKDAVPATRTTAPDEEENADNALVWERTIEYLANPGKGTLLALITAKVLGV